MHPPLDDFALDHPPVGDFSHASTLGDFVLDRPLVGDFVLLSTLRRLCSMALDDS